MRYHFALSLLITLALSSGTKAGETSGRESKLPDSCAIQYRDLLLKMTEGLRRTQGVETRWGAGGREAGFKRDHRAIFLNARRISNDVEAAHAQFHESVHATTVTGIVKSYSPENAARGIYFRKTGDRFLSEQLPEPYRSEFFNDEKIAYQKSSIHARQLEENKLLQYTRILPSTEQKALSELFGASSKAFLKQLRSRLRLDYWMWLSRAPYNLIDFDAATPHIKYAVFSVPQKNGEKVEIGIPIRLHAPPTRLTHREVLEQCLQAINADLR